MDSSVIFRPRGKYVFRDIAGECILVPVRAGVRELDSLFTLNETGALIWKTLEIGASLKDIVKAVMEGFEIDRVQAENETSEFLNILTERGLVEKNPS